MINLLGASAAMTFSQRRLRTRCSNKKNPIRNQKQKQKSVAGWPVRAEVSGRQLEPLNAAGAAWAHNLKQQLTQLDNKPLSRAGWQTGKTAFNSFRCPLRCSCIH